MKELHFRFFLFNDRFNKNVGDTLLDIVRVNDKLFDTIHLIGIYFSFLHQDL